MRRKTNKRLFPKEVTEELKGFAILAVVFSHIGYFLSTNDRFLWPLSTMAGVGVNLFLFLSGYGLTLSALKVEPSLRRHTRRIAKLFVPLWIVVVVYFLLDHFILHTNYSDSYILHSFAGYFPKADLMHDVNSVLWYFSLILIYYLLFPFVFMRRHVWGTAVALFLLVSGLVLLNPTPLHDVVRLYRVHTAAFPLGVLTAWFITQKFLNPVLPKLKKVFSRDLVKYPLLIVLALGIGITAIYSNVGSSPFKEQLTSIASTALVMAFFILKPFRLRLLTLFGVLSYEIYLLHWPLLSRYDILYTHFPAWIATGLYLVVFIIIGRLLATITDHIFYKKDSPSKTPTTPIARS